MKLSEEQRARVHELVCSMYGMVGGIYGSLVGVSEVRRLFTILANKSNDIDSVEDENQALSFIKICLEGLIEDIKSVESKINANYQ